MKTCGKHGQLEPEHIYFRPNGETECRLCQREAMKKHRRKNGKRTYMQHLYEVRGEEMPKAAVAPRQKKRYANAYLSRRQIAAAYELYKAGMSTSDIAKAGWEKWGFTNQKRCSISLVLAFRRDGYPTRNQRDAQRLRWGSVDREPRKDSTGCAGCGCDLDERSMGCDTCRARHWYRLRQKKAASLREAA